MLKVNILNDKKENNVELGQIRYNNRGMFVLIVRGQGHSYDAIVLKNDSASNDIPTPTSVHASTKPSTIVFDWNSRGQSADSISLTYPYIANGELTITK